MPARDLYHDTVKSALIADGWTITHDPLLLQWGGKDVYLDLFQEPIGQLLLKKEKVRLLVFDPKMGVILEWIPS